MVAKIWTPASETATLADEFKQELTHMMKKAALDMGCNVEELKWRADNLGIVEIQRMDADEMLEMQAQDAEAKRIREIKKSRGL